MEVGGILKYILGAVQYLFLLLDWAVYSLINAFYTVFFAITEIKLFDDPMKGSTQTFIELVASNIYVIIGIIALFKIVFSLIMMILNPDMMTDKQKGGGKLITKFLTMLVLIIAVPYIFNLAYDFQSLVLKENLIGKIISVGQNETTSTTSTVSPGERVANLLFKSFVTKNDAITSGDCEDAWENAKTLETTGVKSYFSYVNKSGKTSSNKDGFCNNYMWGISTIAGAFAAWIFLVYCLDIGLRAVKLSFLQLISPIPIVSYITVDKDSPFQKWIKMCLSTYADLFIRLVIINFFVQIIPVVFDEILNPDTGIFADITGNIITKGLGGAAIIIGILTFAQQAPQLIKDLFGIKGDSDAFGFGAKKVSKIPLVGKSLAKVPQTAQAAGGAALAYAGGQVKNQLANIKDAFANPDKLNENAAIRNKATQAEALMRLNPKNSKDRVYNGTTRKELIAQAINGDVNAQGGLYGRANSKAQDLMGELSYETGRNKSPALAAVKAISARLGNIGSNLKNERSTLEARKQYFIDRGDDLDSDNIKNIDAQLTVSASFNPKAVFEEYVDSIDGIDHTFQNMPDVNDKEKWDDIREKMSVGLENYLNNSTLTLAAKEKIRDYAANSGIPDMQKPIDTQTKNK